jgi:hypothetical protein
MSEQRLFGVHGPDRSLYIDDAYIESLNARVAHGHQGMEFAADVALWWILEDHIRQVLHIEGTPVTLLFLSFVRPLLPDGRRPWGRFAILVNGRDDVTFTNDPWYWEGLTYRPREAS